MKIVQLGNFRVPFTTESDLKWSLESMGHKITPLQEAETTGEIVFNLAKDADVFLYTHTHGWETPGLRKAIWALNDRGVPTAAYHLDIWLGLPRQADMGVDDFWEVKYFFTVDKNMATYMNRRKDLPQGIYLKPGVVERDCNMVPPIQQLSHNAVFVGSQNYHSSWPYRPKLIQWLKSTYGTQFAHYGHDGLGVMRGAVLNRLYSSARIVVGDSLCHKFTYENYWSDRVYETLGRGGFLIHPYIKGMDEEFTDGVHLKFYDYGDFEELEKIIDYYISHPLERERIRQMGHTVVKNNYTYTHRMRTLLRYLVQKEPSLKGKKV